MNIEYVEFCHPDSGEICQGKRLLPGQELEETDYVLETVSGKYMKFPFLKGMHIRKKGPPATAIWVRPVSQEMTTEEAA